eukprot:TRINITY_DN2283_c0_g1_i2.p1 TRINITY_DN2283_c0_g1~~TRINITY_DN2283_c0_g1_i2.p1  ORF type:complete len:413 (+),score=97.23 TRINITY_DN2283_c0_g1_i2:84-1241(+)
MPPIPERGTVAVTGAAGFIGGWIVKALLDRGYTVKACVRDAGHEKCRFLREMPGFLTGRLSLHSCNIDVPGVFDSVFPGCHGVVHAAADLVSPGAPAPSEAVLPSARGSEEKRAVAYQENCRYIIDSINKAPSVGRLIFTSSIATVIFEADPQEYARRPVFYEGRYPNEDHPKRKNLKVSGYSVGKLAGERMVAEAAAASNGQWDVLISNPADNIGPILAKHQLNTGWQNVIVRMLTGKPFAQNGLYRPWMTVDVRDVAEAHVRLLESATAACGTRYLLWPCDKVPVEDVARGLLRVLPSARLNPSLAPTDGHSRKSKDREGELRRIWAGVQLRNDRARGELGMRFRAFDDSLRDCAESLMAVGGVTPRREAPQPSKAQQGQAKL